MTKVFKRYLLYILFAALGLAACHKKEKKTEAVVRPVKSIVVSSPESVSIRHFPGTVLPGKETKLSFEITGRLTKLPINEGQIVQQNQLVAQIDPKKYQEKVDETEAKYLETLAQYKRAKKLVKDDYISRARYDAIQANYKVAKANYDTAKHNLSDTYLRAPFTGVIAKKYVDNYEFVKAKQSIADLHNTATVDIDIDVPENIMINLSKENSKRDAEHRPVAIFNARPNTKFQLAFKEVTTTANPETQTYRIVFTMNRPENLNILPGMNVSVEAAIPDFNQTTDSFYLLPSGAVFMSKNNQPTVWVIDKKNMTVKHRAITTSHLVNNKIKVLSGIKAGDRIVTAGAHYLHEGEKVKLLKNKPETN